MIAFVFAVLIALLDTGINVNHPHFEGVTIHGDMTDSCGHGTALAGTIVDATPYAEIVSINVETNCFSSVGTIARVIKEAVDLGADIIVVAWNASATEERMAESIAYAEASNSHVVLSEGLKSMIRIVPTREGGYGYLGGPSVTAAWVAGQMARPNSYLPVVNRE